MKNVHFQHHVTHDELATSQDKVLNKLMEHEREEFSRYDLHLEANKQMMKEYRAENMEQHGRINSKIDKLIETIIDTLRDRR